MRLRKPHRRAFLKQRLFEDLAAAKRVRGWRVSLSVNHLHGPKEIAYAPDELVVVCVVRNGRPYVRSFVDHHLSLGAKHIFFLDNGSDDGTVAAARDHERVTVLQTKLPFGEYGYAMKRYLISRFGRGRWSLHADIDELFDYPYSDVVDLSSFLRYLNEKSYTAVVAQMLDMFPDRALSSRASQGDEPLKELYRYYDLSNIERQDYHRSSSGRKNNVVPTSDIEFFRGGIHKTLFGAASLLTKHPLTFFDGEVRHPWGHGLHHIANARVADFSCVLYHYKLTDGFAQRVAQDARARPRLQYIRTHEALKRNPGIEIRQGTARELRSVNELIDTSFLVVSEEYKRWANAEKKEQGTLGSPKRSASNDPRPTIRVDR